MGQVISLQWAYYPTRWTRASSVLAIMFTHGGKLTHTPITGFMLGVTKSFISQEGQAKNLELGPFLMHLSLVQYQLNVSDVLTVASKEKIVE